MARNGNGSHYETLNQDEVPQGRKGKHRKAVSDILGDLTKLNPRQAIKIPLSSLNGEKMQNLRSALNRVTREKNLSVETSATRSICMFGKRTRRGRRRQASSRVRAGKTKR